VEKGDLNCRNIEHEFNVWAESMKINWRFFAKEVSPTEFRTRFPSAKAIDELAHFGKLFMKTVPGAIISLVKWAGDIQPIAVMQEAWFRVKGIPMDFRNRSTVFYAASLVGKPLVMDKNFHRNFSYVRVKIGSQDMSLVPSTRIAEIKGGFLCDPTPTPGTRIVVADANQGDGTGNGSPKRQRTGRLDSDAGSQSAPPKINGNTDRNNASHRQTAAAIFVTSEKSTGKRKLFETNTMECAVKDTMESVVNDINAGASGSMPPIVKPNESTHLFDSFASRSVSPGQASSSASVSPSYAHFLHTLAKSGSDHVRETIQERIGSHY
jgi:hypothetical protein